MARIARVVAPGLPHHITQWGNRRQQTFFTDLELIDDWWKSFLLDDVQEQERKLFHKHERTGRPLRSEAFKEKIQTKLNRVLCKQKPGPKKTKNNA